MIGWLLCVIIIMVLVSCLCWICFLMVVFRCLSWFGVKLVIRVGVGGVV